ncbi:MAG: hypothetical protein II510_08205 [Erysipelotrichales bacterium]|nr:hypothetical protein [Erysipelotrichales bacterium]MBQ2310872.1 hypothetical protein [Erysipelotrichales bacterium]MBQ2479434.1 hypothetical protein [Erysipelotrichales bacterium]MBQ4011113.1 hypothetical protein [Erysipelotrichales bacterium]MBQ5542772.1 hypothetical protein [Erysipelotrichales bacterium]
MRTSDERISELHKRMDTRRYQKDLRKYRLQSGLMAAGCLAIVIALSFVMSGVSVQNPDALPGGISASIFADHTVLGYVVIALLAFSLGAFVTVFCYRLKRHMEERDD